jgi:hypothetical protein
MSAAVSCSDILDAPDENAVEAGAHYNNFNDADNAILGIYGKLSGLVDRVIVLNEVRADLLDITDNSTADLAAINNHTADAGNRYCDIAPFYGIILNCNDALANFNKMLAENKLSRDNYDYRYADVATVRSWVYLQLAIHFGNIPYITQPLTSVADIDGLSKYTMLDLSRVIQELIKDMESLPTLELSSFSPLYLSSVDNYNMQLLFLNKRIVLGDLYLWDGQYMKAATQYYAAIAESEPELTARYGYKLDGNIWDYQTEPSFQVCYDRNRGEDLKSYRNKWKEIFSRTSTDNELRREVITLWNYDPQYAPSYPLIELFANTGKGKYRLKPSDWAVENLWEAQIQRENNFVFDGRGRESSFDRINGQPVVIKYLYDYYPQTTDGNKTIHLSYQSGQESLLKGKWFVYRVGLLHLRYAEAANRAGHPDLASALLNSGVGSAYADLPEPFSLKGGWTYNYGIRRRAFVQNLPKPDWVVNKNDSIRWIEESLLTEAALECGFEGHRWGDILRISLRKERENATGITFLNSIIAGKFNKTGKTAPILTPDNWFLPHEN